MKETKLISIKQFFICFLLLAILYSLLSTSLYAELLDRVVAIVDDEVVMLSEFKEAFQRAENSGADITEMEVLDSLINRTLLLKQAKRFNIEFQTGKDNDAIINEYIERKLRVFIHIPFDEIELFYKKNKGSFKGQDFYDVRDEIEKYLIEEELNKKLIEHIEELRKKAYIRIQIKNTEFF